MQGARRCYVAMPFGKKALPSGLAMDFDEVYRVLFRPALESLQCVRADELTEATVIHKSVLAEVIGADVLLADLTGDNPNVMYEVGIRHALRRSATILVMAEGEPAAFDVSHSRIIWYPRVVEAGSTGTTAFISSLSSAVQETLARVTTDSPIYNVFPDLRVDLPQELSSGTSRRAPAIRAMPSAPSIGTAARRQAGPATLRSMEDTLRATPGANPFDYIDVLRNYRAASLWEEIVRFADTMPTEVAGAPEVIQIVALALNRRGHSGDHERAIALLQGLIDETGGDPETLTILGRIYKDLYERHRSDNPTLADTYLQQAIDAYRTGFEKDPSNVYPGVNAVSLLVQRQTDDAGKELAALLPRVREQLTRKTEQGPPDYWSLASAAELAAIASDWDDSRQFARRALDTTPPVWMIEGTTKNLETLGRAMNAEDQSRMQTLADLFRSHEREGANAELG